MSTVKNRPAICSDDYKSLWDVLCGGFEPGVEKRGSEMIVGRGLHTTAMEMASDPDPRVAFRASWALEKAYFADPGAFTGFTGEVVGVFLRSGNASVHRHYAKMICHLMRSGRLNPTAEQAEALAEKCFDLLISPRVKVAVKVWVMEVLLDLGRDTEWIASELRDTVINQMGRSGPAFDNHSRKLLRRLKNR